MGLDINSVLFLLAARKRGADFSNVLMIGRQDLNVYPAKMQQVLTQAGLAADLFAPGAPDTGFAEPFFKALGARKISALDASAFEGAEFVHDLNRPINDDLKQKFDLVYDGGTLEHVFNFPVALQNCLEMVNEGGRFITQTCANNWCGHGFYQFSPELFYNVLGDDNGFEVERMIIHMVGPYGRWYEVANPREIQSRVELFNSFPLQLLVQARRTKIVSLFWSRLVARESFPSLPRHRNKATTLPVGPAGRQNYASPFSQRVPNLRKSCLELRGSETSSKLAGKCGAATRLPTGKNSSR